MEPDKDFITNENLFRVYSWPHLFSGLQNVLKRYNITLIYFEGIFLQRNLFTEGLAYPNSNLVLVNLFPSHILS